MTAAQRLTLLVAGLGLFMIFLDAMIVNVALPAIQAAFGLAAGFAGFPRGREAIADAQQEAARLAREEAERAGMQ